jgi:polysaccharide biosynthesis/export protein
MKNPVTVLAPLVLALAVGSAAAAQVPPAKPSPATPGATGAAGTTGTTGTMPKTPRTSAADTAADYRLVAGDKLRIEVYKDAQLSQSLQVRPDGKITLPLVGDLPAAGRTSAELREAITASLKEYNTNPVVTVIVVETVPPVIYVMGEVNNSGPQALTGQMTVLQALASAGGFKDFANTKDIRILRKSSTGLTTTLRFNYKDAMKGIAKPIVLQPGDTIIVP